MDLRWTAWVLLNVPAILLVARTFYEWASAMAAISQMLSAQEAKPLNAGSQPSIQRAGPSPHEAVSAELAEGQVAPTV